MEKKLYTPDFLYFRGALCCLLLIFLTSVVYAQRPNVRKRPQQQDTSLVAPTLDSLQLDSLLRAAHTPKKISPNAIDQIVYYSAADSTVNDLQRRYTYLFGDAVVKYDDMELRADYIEIDFRNNELYASGVIDTSGNLKGNPVFKQGEMEYKAREIKYNFTTHKGKISHVITTEDEGFIHGEQVKKMGDKEAFIKNGKYTTCDLENPHYEIAFTKAKIIQHDKIVIGPAYLSFTGVPTPLALPFGFFPLEKARRSGLVMPSIGESSSLGFYLQDLGFYFGINDNIDLLLSADIYTRGSWAVKAKSDYVYRYKCKGVVQAAFSQTYLGERLIDSSFYHSNDFKIYWDHQQDVKSHPTTRFNAHVDIVSSNYSKYNMTSANDYLSNQYTSSINVSTSARDIFFLDATLSYSQNTGTKAINLKLPDISMSVIQFYPFRKKNKAGALKWYDNISMKWTSQFTGQVDTYDSLFFKPQTWNDMNFGMMHTVPLTIPIKIAKLINWNTTVTLTEKWYLQNYTRDMTIDTVDDVAYGVVNRYFHRGFNALHDLRVSSDLTTKIYVMYSFKKGGLYAIRHVVTPVLNMTYQPAFSKGINDRYYNPVTGEYVEYSYYDGAIFGTVTQHTQALVRLSFGNNLEIKVRSKRDTVTGFKKISIFDNLNVSMNYNIAADSLNWSKLTVTGRSTIFKQLYLTYNFVFDPYIINENGVRCNTTEWKANHRLFRMSSTDFSIALNWRIDQNTFKKKSVDQKNDANKKRLPWSFTFNYTFSYGLADNIYYYRLQDSLLYTRNMIHTINVVGNFYVTEKWKIGFTTGYDFVQKDFSYTSVDVYRDMHCWEMAFSWIPFGYRKGWSFQINVKANVLKNVLKLPLHDDFRNHL
ncbi:MAG: LPS-assembly protein LptD [Bacteroidales bacterium]|nr:LPS-assembly protein LptD [Bacteroidales bacterium]